MFERLKDFFFSNLTPIFWSIVIILGIILGIYIFQHTEFATVTGQVTGVNHIPGYYSTEWTETCSTVGKSKICTWSSETTYHQPTYTIRMFVNDKTWTCSVDYNTYDQATKTGWATAFCSTWNN